ncbi:MAG: COX15/CtaA family protein [Ilumatobacteraceae bacterium]
MRTISPRSYSRLALTALVFLCVIVLTGAAVRLTGSGLGCEDWPRCNEERFIDVSSTHGAIEQINRLFTGLVALSVILAVLGAHRRLPRRADLVRLAWGLVAGVIGQVVLGGIVVLTDLHPLANQGHFLLSMILVTNATVLWVRSRDEQLLRRAESRNFSQRLALLAFALGCVALYTGTIVTGSGPHAGDEDARRFGFDISHVARIHGISVVMFLIALLSIIVVVRRRKNEWRAMSGVLEATMAIGVIQAALGYTQYFNDIPAALVAIHIAGATAIMISLTRLVTQSNRTSLDPA